MCFGQQVCYSRPMTTTHCIQLVQCLRLPTMDLCDFEDKIGGGLHSIVEIGWGMYIDYEHLNRALTFNKADIVSFLFPEGVTVSYSWLEVLSTWGVLRSASETEHLSTPWDVNPEFASGEEYTSLWGIRPELVSKLEHSSSISSLVSFKNQLMSSGWYGCLCGEKKWAKSPSAIILISWFSHLDMTSNANCDTSANLGQSVSFKWINMYESL